MEGRVMEINESQTEGPRTIAITSGKGGVGKTNLAVNLAIGFARLGKRVLLLDADLGIANVTVVLGMIPPPRYNLYHFVTGDKSLKEIVVESPYGIKILPGTIGVSKMANLSHKQRKVLIESLYELNSLVDLIIIDTAAGLSANTLSFALSADEVIIITTTEPTAIAAAYGVIKIISNQNIEGSIKLVINRALNILEGKRVADRIVNIAGQFLSARVERLGYIMEDSLVGQAVQQQKPFVVSYPHSKAAECLCHLRNRLAKIPETQPRGIAALIKGLFLGGDFEEEWA